jgi:hypothetical protein
VVEGLGERVLGRVVARRRAQAGQGRGHLVPPARCSTRSSSSSSSRRRRPGAGAFADHLRDALRRLRQPATAATWRVATSSTSARRSASSRRSRSASRARSSRCVPSTSVARRREPRRRQRRGQTRARCASTTSRPCSTRRATWSRCRARRDRRGRRVRPRARALQDPYGAVINGQGGATRSRPARSSRPGIRTPTRSSPKWRVSSSSRTSSTA